MLFTPTPQRMSGLLPVVVIGTLFFQRPHVQISIHPHATLHSFADGFFMSFRINHGKVILPASRKRSRNEMRFETICQHLVTLSVCDSK